MEYLNEDKSKFTLEIGKIYLAESENKYHDWLIRISANRFDLPIKELEYSSKNLRSLARYGILEESSVAIVDLNDVRELTNDMVQAIERINSEKRIVVLYCPNTFIKNRLAKITNKRTNKGMKIFPEYTEWYEKHDFIRENVLTNRLNFTDLEVQDSLIRFLMREEEYWLSAYGMWDIYGSRYNITMEDIQEQFVDIDFYSLNEWVKLVLQGKTKKKHIFMYNYFRDIKQYSNAWLVKHLREEFIKMSHVYVANRKGIILDGILEYMEVRANAIDWEYTGYLMQLSKRDIFNAFKIIEDMPYRYLVYIQPILFSEKEIYTEDRELLELIETIRLVRAVYDKKDGKGTYVFNRKEFNRKNRRKYG